MGNLGFQLMLANSSFHNNRTSNLGGFFFFGFVFGGGFFLIFQVSKPCVLSILAHFFQIQESLDLVQELGMVLCTYSTFLKIKDCICIMFL